MDPNVAPGEDLQLITVESYPIGPYLALTPDQWDGYVSVRVTRATAERIVTDLNKDDAPMRGEWSGDLLAITWTTWLDGSGGAVYIAPDVDGLYIIGGMWPWELWDDEQDLPMTPEMVTYVQGVCEYDGKCQPAPVPDAYAANYQAARDDFEALRAARG